MSPTLSKDRISQLEHATVLIYEHIKLLDQKALVFIALNGGLIGGLYGIKILESLYVNFILSIIAFLLLLAGMALALLTIVPRRGSHSDKGIVDPWRIAAFENGDEYRKRVLNMTDEEFEKEFTDRIFDLSRIDRSKYGCLKWSIILSSNAWAISLGLAVWHSLYHAPPIQ